MWQHLPIDIKTALCSLLSLAWNLAQLQLIAIYYLALACSSTITMEFVKTSGACQGTQQGQQGQTPVILRYWSPGTLSVLCSVNRHSSSNSICRV